MKRPAYPQYKPSGVEYLGDVPAHWDVIAPKRCVRTRPTGVVPIKNTASLEPVPGYVPSFSASGQDIWLPEPVFFGDGLVLSAVGARCGKTFRASGEWAVSANTHVLFPEDGQSRDYWWYVTNDESWWDRAGGAQPFVRVSKTLNRKIAVPPPAEQTTIVDFLNRETGKTDALVEKKSALIARLKEKRGALISRAVTRGLAPDAPMKDSGVAYLGEVPVEWTVQRLKQTLAKIYSGGTPDTGNEVFWSDDDSGIPWVAIADMSATRNLKSTAKRITEEGRQSKQLPILPRGTILYSMYASLGKVAVLDIPAAVNQAILGMIPSADKLTRGYLSYWLHNMERHILLMSSSNTQSNLNAEKVRNMPIYLPSLSEQEDIVDFLNRETGKIDTLIAKVGETIERLKEHRAALISAAVTGQIDVRSAK